MHPRLHAVNELHAAHFPPQTWLVIAEVEVMQQSKATVVVAQASLCVESFRHATEASANLAALKKADWWSQGDSVAKGGRATVAASSPPDQVSNVVRACATLLAGAQQTHDENGALREDAPHDERGVLLSRKAYDAAGRLTADSGFFADGSRKPCKQWAVRG